MSDDKTTPEDSLEESPKTAPATTKEPKQASAKPVGAKPETARVAPYAVFGGGGTDTIRYSAARPPKPTGSRKVLTVLHVQRALQEKGFRDAARDKGGYYSAGTIEAVRQYQASLGEPESGLLTRAQFADLFKGDVNVTVEEDGIADHVQE